MRVIVTVGVVLATSQNDWREADIGCARPRVGASTAGASAAVVVAATLTRTVRNTCRVRRVGLADSLEVADVALVAQTAGSTAAVATAVVTIALRDTSDLK